MTRPIKKTGWSQGIYEISAVAKERLGTLRILQDGRKFRYAKAGASNISAGKLQCAAAMVAAAINNACPIAAVGLRILNLTVGSSSFAADYFAGGYLQINDAGHQYEIVSSTATSSSTAITVVLEDSLKVALTASKEFTLLHSPWMATVELASGSTKGVPVGVAPVDVTAAYYYWAQTGGPACCLMDGTPAIGAMLNQGTTAGAVAIMSTTFAPDLPFFAQNGPTVGVNGHYKPIILYID